MSKIGNYLIEAEENGTLVYDGFKYVDPDMNYKQLLTRGKTMKEVDEYEGWTLEDHRVYQDKISAEILALKIQIAEKRGAMVAMKQTHQADLDNIESLSSLDGFKVLHFDWDLFESDILKEQSA